MTQAIRHAEGHAGASDGTALSGCDGGLAAAEVMRGDSVGSNFSDRCQIPGKCLLLFLIAPRSGAL